MLFNFGLKSAILLMFFIHGIVYSFLLAIKGFQNDNKANSWLALFTLLCSLYISPFMLGYAGWYAHDGYRDILFYVPFQQLLLLPPVLFFYMRSLLDRSFTFHRKYLIHFIPATLYLIYSIVVVVTDKMVLHTYYFYADGKDKDLSPWYQVAGFLSMAYYLVASLKIYHQYRKITYNSISFADSVMFRWVKQFLVAFLLLLAIRFLFFWINPEWDQFGRKFWYYICFSILFYYISISGYTNSVKSITSFPKFLPPQDENTVAASTGQIVVKEDTQIEGIYPNENKLENTELSEWKAKIEKLMSAGKAFENPLLTISDLCDQLGTHSKKVSQVINQGYNMNFNDFVNQYRVEAVIAKIKAGEHHSQTLLGIAFDCGFNSKSTFNRAFKKHTSLSPKDFIENNT